MRFKPTYVKSGSLRYKTKVLTDELVMGMSDGRLDQENKSLLKNY